MGVTLTISLDDELQQVLAEESSASGLSPEEFAADLIRRHIWVKRFRDLNEKLVPLARAKGIECEEDVFRIVS